MEEIEKLMEVLEYSKKKEMKTARIERTEWHWITLEYDSITDKVKDASADLLIEMVKLVDSLLSSKYKKIATK